MSDPLQKNNFPQSIQDLLFYQGSLTHALEQIYRKEFQHILHSERWQYPLAEERRLLNIKDNRYALVREIFLQHRDKRLVYGRTIIPVLTLKGRERQLAFWGKRSIGDFLFRNRQVWRDDIFIFRVYPGDKYYQLAGSGLSINAEYLWGRHSFFYIRNKPILVVEIFLPGS